MQFEWDSEKARKNLTKGGESFNEAATVFGSPLADTIEDPEHSQEEKRFVTTDQLKRQRTLIVVHTDRQRRVRIINAGGATARERDQY